MELYIKQRVFSLGDSYDVYGENGEPFYRVWSELFSWGAAIHLCEPDGTELFYIRQKVLVFLPEYEIYKGDRLYARVKKEFSFFRPRLIVESGLSSLSIEGDFANRSYTVERNGSVMGELSKRWFSFGDAYSLSVREGEDPAFFTALAVAVDHCLHNE